MIPVGVHSRKADLTDTALLRLLAKQLGESSKRMSGPKSNGFHSGVPLFESLSPVSPLGHVVEGISPCLKFTIVFPYPILRLDSCH